MINAELLESALRAFDEAPSTYDQPGTASIYAMDAEMFIGGMLCESNKREVLKAIVEAEELVEEMTKPGEDTASQLDDGLSFQEQFQLGRKPGRRTGAGGGR